MEMGGNSERSGDSEGMTTEGMTTERKTLRGKE
jgi:hypothetical protein